MNFTYFGDVASKRRLDLSNSTAYVLYMYLDYFLDHIALNGRPFENGGKELQQIGNSTF
jgi:hypothetical protein